MGLSIYGEATGHSWHGSYSTIHTTVRYLALKACGMPDVIGTRGGEPINGFTFYMHPWSYGAHIPVDSMRDVLFAMQVCGYRFPQILLHSDCEGGYTKHGKILGEGLKTGNSVKLLVELNELVSEFSDSDEANGPAYEALTKLRDLVKDEIENGSGRILFR